MGVKTLILFSFVYLVYFYVKTKLKEKLEQFPECKLELPTSDNYLGLFIFWVGFFLTAVRSSCLTLKEKVKTNASYCVSLWPARAYIEKTFKEYYNSANAYIQKGAKVYYEMKKIRDSDDSRKK
jgi:hypothetical protein